MERAALIKERITNIKNQIGSCHLIAVSKYTNIDDIKFATLAGHHDFGESKVQDLQRKASDLLDLNIRWHFIGRLQSNKINHLLKVPGLSYIHSIDSMGLLEALFKRVDQFQGEKLGIFLQFNTSGEEEKGGFRSLEELRDAIQLMKKFDYSPLYFAGLMTIGRIRTENFEEEAKRSFESLGSIRDDLDPSLQLSMGMSSDYKMAVSYGSNFIRVGNAIFR